MKQVLLLGTPDTKRTIYLEQAAAQEKIPIGVIHWKDWRKWSAEISEEAFFCREFFDEKFPKEEVFLKIDPPLWESCSLEELDGLTRAYIRYLRKLSLLAGAYPVTFLNEPEGIEALLDKKACKEKLRLAGLSVTEPLYMEFYENWSTELLLEQMKAQRIYQVFVKPIRGSGAAGVSAFRYQPSTGRMALYTCALQTPEHGLINTKRLRHFSQVEEIVPLLNRILSLGCIVERWYAKAEYQGYSYDLRVVIQDKKVDFALARLSKGPITNLHLNNHPLEANSLGLSQAVWDEIVQLCHMGMECYPGLRSVGMDILLEKGTMKPRIIEMNAQGDLIYQDIYHENRIYSHQAKMMKEWME